MGQLEGTDIPSSFDHHSENKRKDKSRNNLKREGDQEAKYDRRIEIDKRDIEMM
jgi:hypothetical protein